MFVFRFHLSFTTISFLDAFSLVHTFNLEYVTESARASIVWCKYPVKSRANQCTMLFKHDLMTSTANCLPYNCIA